MDKRTDSSPVVFVDVETTGLDPDRHEIWEVALIDSRGTHHVWHLEVDEGRADAYAMNLNGYFLRFGESDVTPIRDFAQRFAFLTAGAHLANNNVSFDEERLRKLLRANGACPRWHYHLVDVEPYVAGKLGMEPPWKSEDLSRKIGVDPEQFERHTALGDCLWAKAMYEAVLAL